MLLSKRSVNKIILNKFIISRKIWKICWEKKTFDEIAN